MEWNLEIASALIMVVTSAVLTGIVTAIATVAAIRVHITYLRDAISKAFGRIEAIEQLVMKGEHMQGHTRRGRTPGDHE